MKPLILLGTVLTASIFLAACDPKNKPKPEKPAPTVKKKDSELPPKPGERTLPDATPDETGPSTNHDTVDTNPHTGVVPPPPKPDATKDEYAKKISGKAGFVTDPNDPQGRPLDVRGMPPGTKIQSPWSGSILLVPPQ